MTIERAKDAAAIIFDADKSLVGRTRLQKLACLFELAGVGAGFNFSYHHYGPYSRELSVSVDDASAIGLLEETVTKKSWGEYSSYQVADNFDCPATHSTIRSKLASIAKSAGNVEFELAVTAAFISTRGIEMPWDEVRKRKPLKADKIPRAKQLYAEILKIKTVKALPNIING